MKAVYVALCCFVINVLANTEAFYVKLPNVQLESKQSYEQITIDEVNKVKFTVPSPNSQNHSYKWFKISGGNPGDMYNARFSWSALVSSNGIY